MLCVAHFATRLMDEWVSSLQHFEERVFIAFCIFLFNWTWEFSGFQPYEKQLETHASCAPLLFPSTKSYSIYFHLHSFVEQILAKLRKKSVIWLTIISVFRVQSAQTNRQHTHSNEWVDAGRPSLNSNYLLTLMSNVLLWAPWEITVISFFYRRIANDERISKCFN